MLNSSHKGSIAETAVLSELVKRGFKVSIPFGDYRYDMVIEREGQFSRIQVKFVSWITTRKTVELKFYSLTRHGRKKYESDEVDYFIAYHQILDRFYIVPFEDVKNQMSLQLRLEKPANGQRSKITFASQYENKWNLLVR